MPDDLRLLQKQETEAAELARMLRGHGEQLPVSAVTPIPAGRPKGARETYPFGL